MLLQSRTAQLRKLAFLPTSLIAAVLFASECATSAQQNCTDDGSGTFGSVLDFDEFNNAVQALPPGISHAADPATAATKFLSR